MSSRPPHDPPARPPGTPRRPAGDPSGQRQRPPAGQQPSRRTTEHQQPARPPRPARRTTASDAAPPPPRSAPPRRTLPDEDDELLLPDEQLEPFRPSKGALVVASIITVLAVAFLVLGRGGGSGDDADATPSFEDEVYVTRDGDTLSSVSQLLSVDEAALADANGLSTSDALTPGTTLDVPDDPGVTETTPAAIAQVQDHQHIQEELTRWAEEYQVDPALLQALAWEESGWDNGAVSDVGAVGIGQLLPETATYVSQDLLDEPTLSVDSIDDNIQMSARYLAYLLELNDGDWGAALASYNQGPTSVRRNGWSAEATQYVTNVMALTRGFQAAGQG